MYLFFTCRFMRNFIRSENLSITCAIVQSLVLSLICIRSAILYVQLFCVYSKLIIIASFNVSRANLETIVTKVGRYSISAYCIDACSHRVRCLFDQPEFLASSCHRNKATWLLSMPTRIIIQIVTSTSEASSEAVPITSMRSRCVQYTSHILFLKILIFLWSYSSEPMFYCKIHFFRYELILILI